MARTKKVVCEGRNCSACAPDFKHSDECLSDHNKTVDSSLQAEQKEILAHPLAAVFMNAIAQAMWGKGERHGGATTPFFEQPWAHYATMHGRGFLTGQATKKLEEAAHQREGDAFINEMYGAIVYAGMAILKERGDV